ncbi:MAG: hypothetical protein KAS46_05550 [Candidatus Aureabacteria bacterium]|nr:hypothetical protein [Candidatus Auribacterota bacterium]
MQYRINKNALLDLLSIWDGYLKRQVHLIACGGTALTLMNIKESTKDIDFIVPEENEYKYLIKTLKDLGYKQNTVYGWQKDEGFIFDLYAGNKVYTTDLVESPLKEGNNILVKEFTHIYLGILNYYDLIISKIFRCTNVDIEDCILLLKKNKTTINKENLRNRYYKTASYDISTNKCLRNFEYFQEELGKAGL